MAKDAEKKPKKENKHFFKDFKAELKKVIWPTTRQVVNNTVAVITIVLITAVIVFALDLVFKALNTYGIDNIRNIVKNETTVNNVDTESEATGSEDAEQKNEASTNEQENTPEVEAEPVANENTAEVYSVQE